MKRWIAWIGVVVLALAAGSYARRAARLLWADRQAAEVARVAAIVQEGKAPPQALIPWIRTLREAMETDPTNLQVLSARGDLFLLLGREESALTAYDRALALEARSEVYFNRSLALDRLGRRREAEADRERAFQLDPRLGRRYRRGELGAGAE